MTDTMNVRLEIEPCLLKAELPSFMAKTLMPICSKKVGESGTVRSLLSFIYRQVKPMLKAGIEPARLYLTTSDGFFLPPNALIGLTVSSKEAIKLMTWQKGIESTEQMVK